MSSFCFVNDHSFFPLFVVFFVHRIENCKFIPIASNCNPYNSISVFRFHYKQAVNKFASM